jgi:hypothetical protein
VGIGSNWCPFVNVLLFTEADADETHGEVGISVDQAEFWVAKTELLCQSAWVSLCEVYGATGIALGSTSCFSF